MDYSTGCGMWTHDEAAILYNIAWAVRGPWLDIGGYVGWTAVHIAAAGCHVKSLDPSYSNSSFLERTTTNIRACGRALHRVLAIDSIAITSDEFFASNEQLFAGIMIDGNHSAPYPKQDAINADKFAAPDGVVLFHDVTHPDVREGLKVLIGNGWNYKLYWTPHLIAVCWRPTNTGFKPPEHNPDPFIKNSLLKYNI